MSDELIDRIGFLLNLDKPENGGPYSGYAAEEFIKTVRTLVNRYEELKDKLQQISDRAGKWISAGIDDPNACKELKEDFKHVIELLPPPTGVSDAK